MINVAFKPLCSKTARMKKRHTMHSVIKRSSHFPLLQPGIKLKDVHYACEPASSAMWHFSFLPAHRDRPLLHPPSSASLPVKEAFSHHWRPERERERERKGTVRPSALWCLPLIISAGFWGANEPHVYPLCCCTGIRSVWWVKNLARLLKKQLRLISEIMWMLNASGWGISRW